MRMAPEIAKIVKMADLIVDAWWIHENQAGIHSGVVAKTNSNIMAAKAVELEAEQHGWLDAVNGVLMELGMPYISHSMKLTPP